MELGIFDSIMDTSWSMGKQAILAGVIGFTCTVAGSIIAYTVVNLLKSCVLDGTKAIMGWILQDLYHIFLCLLRMFRLMILFGIPFVLTTLPYEKRALLWNQHALPFLTPHIERIQHQFWNTAYILKEWYTGSMPDS
jgi:hypothetical protein